MKLHFSLIGIGIAASLLSSLPAHAANIDLDVFKAIDTQDPNVRCPAKVVVTETSQPYREGGYTIDGSANLSAIATGFTIARSDEFSVTWVGKLKPQYRQCKATARIVKSDNEDFSGHSYLRMQFLGGKVYLILDMTGMSDANSLTTAILKNQCKAASPSGVGVALISLAIARFNKLLTHNKLSYPYSQMRLCVRIGND